MWPLAWLAPLPVLAFAFAAPTWIAAASAFAAYALGGSALWQLAAGVVPAPLVAAFVLISAAAFMIMVLLTRHAVRRLGHWVAVFTYPILFTAWEYLNSIAGTSGSIANSQIDFPPAVQIAALIGSWGVTFLVALVPAAVAVAWQLRLRREQAAWALAVPFALCAAALAWGAMRLMRPASGPVVRVGL